jgi:hypothetical protein
LLLKELPTRGLSAKDAKLVYDEKTPDLPPDVIAMMRCQAAEDRRRQREMKGRPTKKDRRELQKWRGKS